MKNYLRGMIYGEGEILSKNTLKELPYSEVGVHVYARGNRHLGFWVFWDYDITRAMDEIWLDLERKNQLPEYYEIVRIAGRRDYVMRRYESPLKN